ncbi:DUF485 domain-containing protein [Streptomyces sp. NPDC003470]|uniref:DUF485 domain-containing protein n=1 Tax=unclassified Streptomyces TaxID=2593676 RepID=UPI003663E2FB
MSFAPYPPPRHGAPPSYEPAPPWQPPGHHGDLRALRGAHRRQRRTATFAALGYFLLFLGLSAFAPSSLTGEVTDGLPLGLLLALLQLPVTWLAIVLYEHTARRTVDPLADRVRRDGEANAGRGAVR